MANTIACCSADTIGAVCCWCRRATQRCRRWSPPFPYCLFGIHLSSVATCFSIRFYLPRTQWQQPAAAALQIFVKLFHSLILFAIYLSNIHCKVRVSFRKPAGRPAPAPQYAAGRARDGTANSAERVMILPRQSSATKTVTAIWSHEGALSFIAELIGNCHGRQQWICVLFG